MADKILKDSGDIYTNAVGNNVVVIDPNKVVVNGKVQDRLVNTEDLVMYANLTAQEKWLKSSSIHFLFILQASVL